MILHRGGVMPSPPPTSTQFPFLMTKEDGMFAIPRAGGLSQLVLPEIASMLRDRRWTVDTRRGVIVVEQ
jgi:hypothetical protein